MAAEPTLPERAPARRPRVVLVDVFETMLRVDALRTRFVDIGRPAEDVQLFFARTLRDGMALTLAGPAPPFLDVARAALRALGPELSPEAVEHVLAGMRELPLHPAHAVRHHQGGRRRRAVRTPLRTGVGGPLLGLAQAPMHRDREAVQPR